MARQPNIFLVGPMGAGKTTIGRRLAQMRGMEFIDTDTVIEERTGVDIPFIFEKEGEEGFRLRESKIIEEYTALENVILATGGGSVLEESNRKHLSARGVVVYLHTPVSQQVERTRHSRNRPLLNAANDREQVLEELMNERHPLYQEIADIEVTSDSRHPKMLARRIDEQLRTQFVA